LLTELFDNVFTSDPSVLVQANCGMLHLGVVKALLEIGVLPQIISGSGVGAIFSALICSRTDEELSHIGSPDFLTLQFPSVQGSLRRKLKRFLSEGILMDISSLIHCVRSHIGDITFEQAYHRCTNYTRIHTPCNTRTEQRSAALCAVGGGSLLPFSVLFAFPIVFSDGRICNITIVPIHGGRKKNAAGANGAAGGAAGANGVAGANNTSSSVEDEEEEHQHSSEPLILNHLTAPTVLIWSAACASCALPHLYRPVELLAKNPEGHIVPYFAHDEQVLFGAGCVDGSVVKMDVALDRLRTLFNVNNFIICQLNLSLLPFIFGGAAFMSASPLQKLLRYLAREIYQRVVNVSALFGLASHSWGSYGVVRFATFVHSLTSQTSRARQGDGLTLIPPVSLRDYSQLLDNPTTQRLLDCVDVARRYTWTKGSLLKAHCAVEFALDRCVRRVRGEMVPGSSAAAAAAAAAASASATAAGGGAPAQYTPTASAPPVSAFSAAPAPSRLSFPLPPHFAAHSHSQAGASPFAHASPAFTPYSMNQGMPGTVPVSVAGTASANWSRKLNARAVLPSRKPSVSSGGGGGHGGSFSGGGGSGDHSALLPMPLHHSVHAFNNHPQLPLLDLSDPSSLARTGSPHSVINNAFNNTLAARPPPMFTPSSSGSHGGTPMHSPLEQQQQHQQQQRLSTVLSMGTDGDSSSSMALDGGSSSSFMMTGPGLGGGGGGGGIGINVLQQPTPSIAAGSPLLAAVPMGVFAHNNHAAANSTSPVGVAARDLQGMRVPTLSAPLPSSLLPLPTTSTAPQFAAQMAAVASAGGSAGVRATSGDVSGSGSDTGSAFVSAGVMDMNAVRSPQLTPAPSSSRSSSSGSSGDDSSPVSTTPSSPASKSGHGSSSVVSHGSRSRDSMAFSRTSSSATASATSTNTSRTAFNTTDGSGRAISNHRNSRNKVQAGGANRRKPAARQVNGHGRGSAASSSGVGGAAFFTSSHLPASPGPVVTSSASGQSLLRSVPSLPGSSPRGETAMLLPSALLLPSSSPPPPQGSPGVASSASSSSRANLLQSSVSGNKLPVADGFNNDVMSQLAATSMMMFTAAPKKKGRQQRTSSNAAATGTGTTAAVAPASPHTALADESNGKGAADGSSDISSDQKTGVSPACSSSSPAAGSGTVAEVSSSASTVRDGRAGSSGSSGDEAAAAAAVTTSFSSSASGSASEGEATEEAALAAAKRSVTLAPPRGQYKSNDEELNRAQAC
jgi:predicted acylesterase/phospholipase RssA